MLVLGTAGHVDHGKSTLIKTLTGIDPDRLREEKERQMTIDLGFAWLELPSGREIGIVDVPGHRDFIENMLAGVGGIDAVLFIIAADEGIMPQTREHLAILDILGIEKGIIVLTKIDTVDDVEWLDLIQTDIIKTLQGTCLSAAEIIPVSSITHEGLDSLIHSIDELVMNTKQKFDKGKPRLPIDRIFSLKGFGTVVTGTQLDGRFNVGQQVSILPGDIQSRIRSIQTHKKKTDEVEPGSRAALNLVGVDVDQLKRGQTVILPNSYFTTRRVDASFRMIEAATGKLEHDDQVKFFSGTSQTSARIRLIAVYDITAGQHGWLQMEFDDEILVAQGDHFILRRPSPPETIGGGVILNPQSQKRHKRFSQITVKIFEMLESGSNSDRLMAEIDRAGSLSLGSLKNKMGLSYEEIGIEVKKLLHQKYIVCLNGEKFIFNDNAVLISCDSLESTKSKINSIIDDFYLKHPLRAGIKKEELRTELKMEPRLFSLLIEYCLNKKEFIEKDGLICLPGHQILINNEQRKKMDDLLQTFEQSPFLPPSKSELSDMYGYDLLQAIILQGELIQTSDQIVFRKKEYDEMYSYTMQILKNDGSISLGQFRDQYNTSRKFALSFLEHLDLMGVTERKEDVRVLKSG